MPYNRLSDINKASIIEDYNNGSRVKELCLKYGFCETTIRKWFKAEGLKTRFDVRGQKKVIEILKLWDEVLTPLEICSKTGYTYKSVIQTLYREGKKPRYIGGVKRNTINDNYFEKIDSEKKAYFFGLLCADGYVNKGSNRIGISLVAEDSYLIEELNKEVGSSYKLMYYKPKQKGKIACRLQLYSKKMVSDLIKHGCVEQKSKNLKFPSSVSYNLLWHFIRGVFDGDGCISVQRQSKTRKFKRISFVSTRCFNETLRGILMESGINSCLSIHKKTICTDLVVYKDTDVNIIFEKMYDGATIWMKRKKDKFDAITNFCVNKQGELNFV